MEKIKTSLPLKIISVILIAVLTVTAVLSSLVVIVNAYDSYYSTPKKPHGGRTEIMTDLMVNSVYRSLNYNDPVKAENFNDSMFSSNLMVEVRDEKDNLLYSNTDSSVGTSLTETLRYDYSFYRDINTGIYYRYNELHSAIVNGDFENELTTFQSDSQTETTTVAAEAGYENDEAEEATEPNTAVDGENSLTVHGRKVPDNIKKYEGTYYVTVHLKDKLEVQDIFYTAQKAFTVAEEYNKTAPVILAVSLILITVLFIYLMAAAGHKAGVEGIYVSRFNRFPIDLHWLFGLTIQTSFIGICLAVFDEALYHSDLGTHQRIQIIFVFVLSVISALAVSITATVLCQTTAVRIKTKTFIKSTAIYKAFHFVFKWIKWAIKHIPMVWRTALALGIILFAGLMFVLADLSPLVYIILILLSAAIFFAAVISKEILKGTEDIAKGNLRKIDTKYLFGDFKTHAENINHINDGIAVAVSEQMKSERFKTELITNVSHDIKTPLTSIINYVDLLQKENIDNETAKEYIEVLSRQSARLKKLIVDLLDASKASTGNVNVTLENFDIGILLAQGLGEYAERFNTSGLDTVVNTPEKPVSVTGDSRLVWRIFDNILNNISKYAQPHTRVYIDVSQKGQAAQILFRNISKEQLNISGEELMERFVRGDSSRNTEGSGLGLSIAKSLAELQNGQFEIQIDGDLFKVILVLPLAN